MVTIYPQGADVDPFSQVLYLVEPIDEVAIQNLQTYKEKKFVDISKEDLELGQYLPHVGFHLLRHVKMLLETCLSCFII